MSAPDPETVNVPLLYEALPAAATLPMSADDQPLGSVGGAAVPLVWNDHTDGDAAVAVMFAIVLLTIFQ